MLKLNLGSGNSKIDGFTNIDIYKFPNVNIVHNIEKTLPFENEIVDEIYCSHTIEHCEMISVNDMLKDWHRILKKGGVVRIIVPEIEACLKNFLNAPENEKWGYRIEYIYGGQGNQTGQQLHKSGYTEARLRSLVEAAGLIVDKIQIINNGCNDCLHLFAHK